MTLGLVSVAAVLWLANRSPQGSTAQLLATGRSAFERGDYETAFLRFSAAATVLPGDVRLAKAAAESALGAGRRPEAMRFAALAWEAGLRDEDLLAILLLDDLEVRTVEGRRQAATLISQLPPGPARDRSRARLHAQEGDLEAALTLWRRSLAEDTESHFIDEYLRLLAAHGRTADLRREGEFYRQRDVLGGEGYRLLALALAETNRTLPVAERVDPTAVLREADARGRLNDDGRLALGLHHWYRLELPAAHAAFAAVTTGTVRIDAALFLLLIASELGTADTAADLPIDGPRAEGLALVRATMASAAPLADRIHALRRAGKLLGEHPVTSILLGRLLRDVGRFEEALLAYRSIDGLAASAPTVLIDQAEIHADLGRPEAALALVAAVERQHGRTLRAEALLQRLVGELADGRLRQQLRRALHRPATGPAAVPLGGTAVADLDTSTIAALDEVRDLIAAGRGEAALRRCAEIQAGEEILAAHRALALHSLGRSAEAIAEAAVAARVPQPPAVALAQAAAALDLGRHAEAEDILTTVLAAHPTLAEAHRLAILAALAGENPALTARRVEAARDAGVSAPWFAPLAAFVAVRGGDKQAGIATLRAQLANAPAADPLAVALLVGLLDDAGDLDGARTVLQAALAHDPAQPELRRHLVAIELRRDDAAGALAAIEGIPVTDAAGRALRLRLLLAVGEIERAQRLIDRLAGEMPAVERALANAAVQRAADRPAAAVLQLQAHLTDPEVFLAWIELAQTGAPVDLAAGLRDLPPDRMRSILAAGAAEQRGEWVLAAAILDDALLRWGEDDPVLLNNWAWVHHHTAGHDPVMVRTRAERAVALAPGEVAIIETLVAILIVQEDLAAAEAVLTQHEALTDGSAPLRYLRGDLRRRQGNTAAAADDWTQALRLADAAPTWPLRIPRESFVDRIDGL